MKAGDTVAHDKSGRVGVVKETNWKGGGYVRVQFDGRQSVMSPRTLRVVSKGEAAKAAADNPRLEEVERQRAVVKRRERIPYALMEEAVASFRLRFPDADDLKPGWYGGRVYVEVWKSGRAKVLVY